MAIKSKFVLVVLESVISGHRRFLIRERIADKLEAILADPHVRRKVLYKEVKRVKGKNSEQPVHPFNERDF